MQWNSFGYEHLDGGVFDNTLVAWIAGYKQYKGFWLDIKGMEVNAGVNYGLDCTLIK